MQKVITRRQILRALRTEPLRGGAWFDAEPRDSVDTCHVCAVGAVVRQVFHPDGVVDGNHIADTLTYNWNFVPLEKLLKRGSYFAALSNFFELELRRGRKSPRLVNQKDREKLCNFVKKNFPKEITIKI